MSVKKNLLETEPVVITTVVTTVIGAAITLGVEFGIDVTQGQQTAIQAFVVAVLAIVYLLVVRPKVTPTAEVVVQNDGSGPRAAQASELTTGVPVIVDRNYDVDALGH